MHSRISLSTFGTFHHFSSIFSRSTASNGFKGQNENNKFPGADPVNVKKGPTKNSDRVPKSTSSMMESPPSVEETVACIATLYHNPNPEEKSQANQWLQILQNSVFAWKVITTSNLTAFLIGFDRYGMLRSSLEGFLDWKRFLCPRKMAELPSFERVTISSF